MDPLVSAAAIGAVPATLAAVLSYRANVLGRRNARALVRVEKATNGELDKKIKRAVREVLSDDPEAVAGAVVSEALRDLLDGILEAASDDGGGSER